MTSSEDGSDANHLTSVLIDPGSAGAKLMFPVQAGGSTGMVPVV